MKRTTRSILLCLPVAVAGMALAMNSAKRAEADCDCFAPELCGGSEIVCPPGADCFRPDVCFDRELVCPADSATTAAE